MKSARRQGLGCLAHELAPKCFVRKASKCLNASGADRRPSPSRKWPLRSGKAGGRRVLTPGAGAWGSDHSPSLTRRRVALACKLDVLRRWRGGRKQEAAHSCRYSCSYLCKHRYRCTCSHEFIHTYIRQAHRSTEGAWSYTLAGSSSTPASSTSRWQKSSIDANGGAPLASCLGRASSLSLSKGFG